MVLERILIFFLHYLLSLVDHYYQLEEVLRLHYYIFHLMHMILLHHFSYHFPQQQGILRTNTHGVLRDVGVFGAVHTHGRGKYVGGHQVPPPRGSGGLPAVRRQLRGIQGKEAGARDNGPIQAPDAGDTAPFERRDDRARHYAGRA